MIHVVLTAYNSYEWIGRCLSSIAEQDYEDFSVTMLDDGSTDLRQPRLMETYAELRGWYYVRNSQNMKAPYSFWRAVPFAGPNPMDIIFLIDGDDFLPHSGVLSRIADIYDNDPYIWLTYGQYEPFPKNTGQVLASRHTQVECDNGDFRGTTGRYNHPITFRYFLWQQLREDDFQDDKGEWFRAGFDACAMWPLLELSVGGPGERPHFEFVDEVLYMYNAVNPHSDAQIHVNEVEYSRMVKHRPKRERLLEVPCF